MPENRGEHGLGGPNFPLRTEGQQRLSLRLIFGHSDTLFFLQMQCPEVRRGLSDHP